MGGGGNFYGWRWKFPWVGVEFTMGIVVILQDRFRNFLVFLKE